MQLEAEYPDVTFVYMTGHLDGTGEEGNLFQRNNQIRDFCLANDKVLFDFADIESYDPDGNYFLRPFATDSCDYRRRKLGRRVVRRQPRQPALLRLRLRTLQSR